MSSDNDLPVILVSAVDTEAALEIIKELISDDPEPPQCNGVGSHEGDAEGAGAEAGGAGVVWRLENKYYTARVRLLPCPDRARRLPAGDAQAHLIYLTEDECSEPSALSRRAAAAAARVARGGVRLAAAAAAGGAALQAAAAAARYELVPLREAEAAPPPAGEPFPELRGAARLREALHAHPWPGLQRHGAARAPMHFEEENSSAESSGDESWGSWRAGGEADEADEAGAVERAEQFAAALALLPAAGGQGGTGQGGEGEGDAARRLRAEQLVAAFCRALGHDLAGEAPRGGEGGH